MRISVLFLIRAHIQNVAFNLFVANNGAGKLKFRNILRFASCHCAG